MLDLQYDLPDIEHKAKYVVDLAVIKGERPLFDKSALPPAEEKKSA